MADLGPPIGFVIEAWYCGCCGAVSDYGDRPAIWCRRCEEHVLETGLWEERTWFAQSGRDCPFSPLDRR